MSRAILFRDGLAGCTILLAISILGACNSKSGEINQHANQPSDVMAATFTAHGGLEKWRAMKGLSYQISQGDKIEKQQFDLHSRTALIQGDNYKIGFDGVDVWVSPNRNAYNGRSARFYHNLNFYFFAMPFVLDDPGVHLDTLPDAMLEGKTYKVVKASFEEGVGDASDDDYLLYIDSTSHRLEYLLYTVTYYNDGPSEQYSALRYEAWQQKNGLLVPKLLRGFKYANGHLGDERYTKIFSDIQFSKKAPSQTLFSKPENAEIEKRVTAEIVIPEAYTVYCGGCHGAHLQGGSAGALIKEEWTYGRRKGDMRRNIKFGVKGTDMIAWGTLFTDSTITELVDYIYTAQTSRPDAEKLIPVKVSTQKMDLQISTWVKEGLENPWSIEFIGTNDAIISQRKGTLLLIEQGQLNPLPIGGTPATHAMSSTGGYLDIALDPDYLENGWIYLAYSDVAENGDVTDRDAPALTSIVRGKISDHRWTSEEVLFRVPDSLLVVGGNRWGCRMLFDREKRLYFSIGDMGQAMASQDLSKATGKVFRINRDGTIPLDNPYLKTPQALAAIFTIGNRNVQGITQHPISGEIWATEHGPMGGDELNILTAGSNYGWPLVTYGVDYSGAVVSEITSAPGMTDPVYQWTPSNAICPLTFVDSDLFAEWKYDLIAGALAYEELIHLEIENGEVINQEIILKGFGRIRDLKFGPDGALYVLLNQPDKILRILPAELQ